MIENMYKYVSNVATAISLILQVFLMCFHGQVVMSESENLQNRMYESNWVEMIDAKQKGDYGKILHIFMERLKQNGQILVGKLYPLSLSTFKSVSFRSITAELLKYFHSMFVVPISDYVGRVPFTGTCSLGFWLQENWIPTPNEGS